METAWKAISLLEAVGGPHDVKERGSLFQIRANDVTNVNHRQKKHRH